MLFFVMLTWAGGKFSACRDSSCAKSSLPSRASIRSRPKGPCMALRRMKAAGKALGRACKRLKGKKVKEDLKKLAR